MSGETILVAAGGTGGHLFPAEALAHALIARGYVVDLATDTRAEKYGQAFPARNIYAIPAATPTGGGAASKAKAIATLGRGVLSCLPLLRRLKPAVVVGFGGYPALPALMAATSAKIPSVIHEQNAVLGRVNRFLARRVNAIATAYRQITRLSPKYADKVHLVGNPVRAEVLKLRDAPFPAFTAEGLLRILVTGGSQGARVLSEVVPDGLAMLPTALRCRLQVTQQCRPEDIEAVRARYAGHDIPAELGTYFEDMASRLADAHLFIGRAGASTIAELTAVGRPAILVPLPIATDDHQAANAREMASAGGARAIRQDKFTAAELAKQIQAMAQHPETLANAAHAAWNCGYPNAVSDLADLVESFGGEPLMDVIRVAGELSAQNKEALAMEQAE